MRVLEAQSEARLGEGAQYFLQRGTLIPGLYHCGGGDGLTSLDVLTPLMQWVEAGQAPDALAASRTDADAAAGKGRAVYAFPATSVPRPGADAERPASWRPGPPMQVPAKLYQTWAGAKLFESGYRADNDSRRRRRGGAPPPPSPAFVTDAKSESHARAGPRVALG